MGFEPRGGRAVKASELNMVNKSEENKDVKKERNRMAVEEDVREEEIRRAAKEKKNAARKISIVSPHCVRVHYINGKQMRGRRWVTVC